jgi:formate-nitrite transporter family protein
MRGVSSPPAPREIWENSFEEGERRMRRRAVGQISTGLLGGFDVIFALTVVVVLTGALMTVTDAEVAHALGALPFGIAFVFLTVGRAELFTENFLVPVGAFLAGRGSGGALARMWAMALLFNVVGATMIAALLAVPGVLPESALAAAGDLGQRFVDREIGAAIASAVLAGAAITLYTWVALAARSETTRVVLAFAIGYVLLLPVLNHAVVSYAELILGVLAGTTDAGLGESLSRFAIAVIGNTVGGVGFVTLTRLMQVSGEPHDEEHLRRRPDAKKRVSSGERA